MNKFDVIVVGAGHAGVEAAWAAARRAAMSAVHALARHRRAHAVQPGGGRDGKGHLVREIDALGGLMGAAIDATGIQFKVLNRSRARRSGRPALRRTSVRILNGLRVRHPTPPADRLDPRPGRADSERGGRVTGLAFEDGREFRCRALVITTGTFLNGLIHVGPEQRPAGRAGEPPSAELAASLKSFGFELGSPKDRNATAPGPRQSIDFDERRAAGRVPRGTRRCGPVPFSFSTDRALANRIAVGSCTPTTKCTNSFGAHIVSLPLFNGQIRGIGPRYCPSLEDKVMRFPDRERHQLFLEPEGMDVEEIYVNGYSMSLPADLQERLVQGAAGSRVAEVLRPGYAVEYDFIQPTELPRRWRRTDCPGCFSRARSTELPVTRRPPAGLVAGVNAAGAPKACHRWCSDATRPTSAS